MSAFDFCIADIAARDADWSQVLSAVPATHREAVAGFLCFALRLAEIPHRASEAAVAHTQLHWWRQQLEHPSDANSRHPALQALAAHSENPKLRQALLALFDAAETDLAFTALSGREEMYAWLTAQARPLVDGLNSLLDLQWPESVLNAFARWHAHVQRLRHYLRDVSAGLIYFAEADLQAAGLSAEQLVTPQRGEAFAGWLRSECRRQQAALNAALATLTPAQTRPARPLLLWAAHSAAWVRLCDADGFRLYDHRLEAGPLLRRWTAWRLELRRLAGRPPQV